MYTWENKWCFDWNYVRELFDAEYIQLLSEQFTSVWQLVDDTNTKGCRRAFMFKYTPLFLYKIIEANKLKQNMLILKTICRRSVSFARFMYPVERSSYQVSLTYTEFGKKLIRWRISYVLLELVQKF